jgi:hypothetical protein
MLLDSPLHRNTVDLLQHISFNVTHSVFIYSVRVRLIDEILLVHLSFILLFTTFHLNNLTLEGIAVVFSVAKFVSDQGWRRTGVENALHTDGVSLFVVKYKVGLFRFVLLTFRRIGLPSYILETD